MGKKEGWGIGRAEAEWQKGEEMEVKYSKVQEGLTE